MAEEEELVIHLAGIEKKFRSAPILRGADLKVHPGQVVGIVGENGSGKTTLLRIIMGLIYPDAGKVEIAGQKLVPGCLGSLPAHLGALLETPLFLAQFTGFQNLAMLASIRNEIGKDEIFAVMRQVGLDPESKKQVSKYSLGMRQRLGIAQAVMEKPQIVLLDEPTNGLDPAGVNMFHDLVHSQTKQGTSFVMVTHRQEDLDLLCDTSYRLQSGKLKETRAG